MNDFKNYQHLLDAVRQNYASVVWTHKIQEKQSDIYLSRYNHLQMIILTFTAFTSAGALSLFSDPESSLVKLITVITSFIALSITSYLKFFDFLALSKQNKDAANKLLTIRNELFLLISDLHMMNKDIDDLTSIHTDIVKRLNNLYLEIPTTTDKAVKHAAKALNINKEYTYTDEEIDHFLPDSLKGRIIK